MIADSYAWALTNNWFNKKMGWNDDGTKPFEGMIKRENNDIQLQPEDTTNVAKRDDDEPIPTGPINNCLSEEICNYIGEPYEEYLNDAIAEELADPMGLLPFKSKGGCTLSSVLSSPLTFSLLIFIIGLNAISRRALGAIQSIPNVPVLVMVCGGVWETNLALVLLELYQHHLTAFLTHDD